MEQSVQQETPLYAEPVGGDAAALEELSRALASAAPAEMPALATQLNQRLEAVRGGPDAANVAEFLVQRLAEKAFEHVGDEVGRSCRREAIAALLRLGFPWALQIDPADLLWYRKEGSLSPRRRPALIVGAIIAFLALLGIVIALVTVSHASVPWERKARSEVDPGYPHPRARDEPRPTEHLEQELMRRVFGSIVDVYPDSTAKHLETFPAVERVHAEVAGAQAFYSVGATVTIRATGVNAQQARLIEASVYDGESNASIAGLDARPIDERAEGNVTRTWALQVWAPPLTPGREYFLVLRMLLTDGSSPVELRTDSVRLGGP